MKIWMKKKIWRTVFFLPEYIGFVFYFGAVSYFPHQIVQEAKIELEQPLWFQRSAVASWCRSEQQGFFAATACSPRAFSTQQWLAGLMCELSLTSRTPFKRTKFTKPARSAGQGRTDYPSLTCLGSLRERQRSWAHRSLAPTLIYCDV